jgi:hypothetical protein
VACITVTIGLPEFPGHHRNVVSAAVLVDECAGIADTRNNRGSLKDAHSKILRLSSGIHFICIGALSARGCNFGEEQEQIGGFQSLREPESLLKFARK